MHRILKIAIINSEIETIKECLEDSIAMYELTNMIEHRDKCSRILAKIVKAERKIHGQTAEHS